MNPIFSNCCRIIFSRWTALNLARENQWADEFSEKVINEFVEDATEFLFENGRDMYSDILSSNFERFFDEAFGVVLEDGSASEVANDLFTLYKEFYMGAGENSPYVQNLLKLPQSKGFINSKKIQEGESSDSELSEGSDCDVFDEENREPQRNIPVVDDDGFTLVQSRRR